MPYLLLTPGISGKDGVSRLSREVAMALSQLNGRDGVQVWSLHDGDDPVEELASAGVVVKGASGSKARLAAWSMARAVGSCRGVVVVVMHAHLAPLSLPLHARGALVFDMLLGIEVWKRLSLLQARSFEVAERLLCISEHSARAFAEINPGFERVVVCRPGLPQLEVAAPSRDDAFALTVGRRSKAERYKGHDPLLEVWPSVVEQAPASKLVVVGGGDDRERLIDKAKVLGLEGAIEFPGVVSDDALDDLYRRCAFFVMPSLNEGFGLVFLEAMRSSKACIGGEGAASEIIEHGTTGYVVHPGDTGAVSRALIDLFADDQRRATMGRRGLDRFERHFTSACFKQRLGAALQLGGEQGSTRYGSTAGSGDRRSHFSRW